SLIRLVQYILMLLAVFSALSLMANKHFRFTILGTRTLYIYLLHGIVIQAFRNFIPEEVYNSLSNHLILVILLTLIIVYILGSRSVQKYTKPIVEIGMRKYNDISGLSFNRKRKHTTNNLMSFPK